MEYKRYYKTVADIEALSSEALIKYKKELIAKIEIIKAEALDWNYTYRHLMKRMEEVCHGLEVELEIAAIDRMESDDSDYGSIANIH